jgi:carbonic anhydrase
VAKQVQVSVAIVACMDARLDPLAAAGLGPREAKVVRTAGGRVTRDAKDGLTAACALQPITEIVVIHHTDCAMSRPLAELESLSEAATGRPVDLSHLALITDPQQALAEDLATVAGTPGVPDKVSIRGLQWDLDDNAPALELLYEK